MGKRRLPISAQELETALEQRQIQVLFQPRIHCSDGLVAGFAARAHWDHPSHGVIPPGRIIRAFESLDLAAGLTDQFLSQSISWITRGHARPAWFVAVPISPASLAGPGFLERVCRMCEQSRLSPGRLVLELPGADKIDETGIDDALFVRLRLKGIQLAMTDFAAGYSSLASLSRLPFSDLHITEPFMPAAAGSARGRMIIRTVVELAQRLELRVTVQGVEDEKTFEFLRQLGCDFAQGGHIAPPMDAEAAIEWISCLPYMRPRDSEDKEAR